MIRSGRLSLSWPGRAGLKAKIMAGAVGLAAAFGAAVMGNIHHGLSTLLKEELSRRGATIAGLVAAAAEQHLLTENSFAVHRLLHDVLAGYDDVRYIYVKDRAGRVVSHTFPGDIPRGLAAAHAAGAGVQTLDTEEGRLQDVAVPLMGGRLGSVHVGMKEYLVRGRIVRLVAGWGVVALCSLLLGTAAAYGLTHMLSERVNRVIRVAERVGGGDLDARVEDDASDELGRLARAFNKMTADLKRYEAQLMRSGRLAAIGELASSVAHEINNPLNTIGVCSQALLDRSRSPVLNGRPEFGDFPEYLAAINKEIARCKKITSDLLGFSRRREPAWGLVDLNRVVFETLPLLEPRAQQAGVRLELGLSEGVGELMADPDQLRQVILNIAMNAIDHTPKGGTVALRSSASDAAVVLSVSDTGCGIAPENLARVFDPFFTTRKPGEGTGLGLAICQRIVDGHGGRIEVASEPGKGCEFRVVLARGQAGEPGRRARPMTGDLEAAHG